MLRTRVLAAVIGLPLILGAVILGDPWLTALVAVALAIAALELCHALGLQLTDTLAWVSAGGCAGLALAPHAGFLERDAALAAGIALALAVVVLRGSPSAGWLAVAAALVYVGWLGHYFVLLHHLAEGRDWLLLALLATFAGDTGAYFTGVAFGKHPLAPRISPKKTWEGLAGGVVAVLAATVALYWLAQFEFDAVRAVALGLLIAAAGPLGDLAESAIKRSTGVKDASPLVPGHGGFLDRLDSLLFVVPTVYFFVQWTA